MRARSGVCGGAIVKDAFAQHAGEDRMMDFSESDRMADALRLRVSVGPACGKAQPLGTHVCFAHATSGDAVAFDQVGHFASCIVGHELEECQAIVCSF